jgi:hypothetical protein
MLCFSLRDIAKREVADENDHKARSALITRSLSSSLLDVFNSRKERRRLMASTEVVGYW